METAQEFLAKKGFRKVHQLNKRYNLTIGELVHFLNEYAHTAMKNGYGAAEINGSQNGKIIEPDLNDSSHVSHHVNG